MVNRRSFVGTALVLSSFPKGNIIAQARDLPELEPERTREYTEIPDAADFPSYDGEDADSIVRITPSELEGMSFTVRGTIRHRWVAEEGYGYPAGYEGDVYRSLIWVTMDGGGWDAFLAANDDLSSIEDLRTFAALGVYGGIYEFRLGGIWEVPLILVSQIGPAKSLRS